MNESIGLNNNKTRRVTEADGAIISRFKKTSQRLAERPTAKLAPVFCDCFLDEDEAGVVGLRTAKNSEKVWIFGKLQKTF